MDATESYRHFRTTTDDDNIVWMTFDKAETGTNVFSPEVLDELDSILQLIAAQPPRGLVILSGKPNGFIAGADIKSFTEVRNEKDAMAFLQRGQEVAVAVGASRSQRMGIVEFVSPVTDPQSNTIRVHIRIDNQDQLLHSGDSCWLTIDGAGDPLVSGHMVNKRPKAKSNRKPN